MGVKRKIGVGTFQTTEKMRANVTQVLDTGRLSYGPFCRELEQRFAHIHGCRFGVVSNSGTDALRIALATLKELHGWRDGDEVIVPAVTFVATVNVVLQNNLKPVLVDVEPDYYGIDVEKVNKLTYWNRKPPRAIMPVHLFGQSMDLRELEMIQPLGRGRMKVVEDSCECMLATHHNKPVGSWGDIACFSTYIAHLLTTGVGGIATTNNPDYAAKMRSLVNHGRDGIYISIDDDDGLTAEQLREVVTRRFSFESVGYSSRMTELEAALGVAQLDDLAAQIKQRQENMAFLTAGLKHLEDRLQLPAIRPYTTHSAMMYPIVLKDGNKWAFCNWLEERGIETREMLRLTDQPVYLKMGLWNPDDYPVAKWLNAQGLYVGCHQGLSQDDLDYMIEVIDEYFK